jgi:transcriptional regulator of arginine metabolism
LRGVLAQEGFAVTQATLSRDLVDLGAVKVAQEDGRAVYTLVADVGIDPGAEMARLARAAHELVVSVESSGNIVVVRTPPGGAQYLASAFDRASWSEILGSVAGDDTVLLVTRGVDAGAGAAAEILTMAEGRSPAGAEST